MLSNVCQSHVRELSKDKPKKKFQKPSVATGPQGCRPLLARWKFMVCFFSCCCRAKLRMSTSVLAMAPWPRDTSRSENESFQSESWYYVSFEGLYHDYSRVIRAKSSNMSKPPQIKHFKKQKLSPPSLSCRAGLDRCLTDRKIIKSRFISGTETTLVSTAVGLQTEQKSAHSQPRKWSAGVSSFPSRWSGAYGTG